LTLRRHLASRLGSAGLALAGATLLVTLFLNLIPGDPIDALLGEQATAVDRQALRRAIGLDLPFHEQVWVFVRDLATGELRSSVPPFDRSVGEMLAEKLPHTLALAVLAMLVALALALPLGVAAAARRGTWIDAGAMGFALVGMAMPRFWLGPLLVIAFAIKLDWLPVSGAREGWRSYVLPALTLGTALAAMVSRMTRAALLEVLGEDFVRTARAKGLAERAVLWRHALRNALVPVITVIALQFGALLGGAIVTEKVFNWPGMGTLLLTAISQRDYNTTRAAVLLFTFLYIAVNLLADLLYAVADPRLRAAEEDGAS
jgi:peptide/nickel transport system permease protein